MANYFFNRSKTKTNSNSLFTTGTGNYALTVEQGMESYGNKSLMCHSASLSRVSEDKSRLL
jgi:hypothetical protein